MLVYHEDESVEIIRVEIYGVWTVGDIVKGDDGLFQFYPREGLGYIPSWVLHSIARRVDELNKDWTDAIEE